MAMGLNGVCVCVCEGGERGVGEGESMSFFY